MKSKYKTLLKILMGIMFTAGPVDNDFMYEIVLRFAKKEKWVKLDKRVGRYYLTDKGYNKIKDYIGGDNEQIRK
jgi:hypothetical protein